MRHFDANILTELYHPLYLDLKRNFRSHDMPIQIRRCCAIWGQNQDNVVSAYNGCFGL